MEQFGVSTLPRKQCKGSLSMHTIVLATQKGGSGKSTLAIGLALAAKHAGHNVRLLDIDPQGTLLNWQSRRGLAEPMVETVQNAVDIEHRLESLARGGVTLTIIDTAAGVSAATTAAIRCCDLCLIPARPSVADIEAASTTLSIARAWKKPFAFVLNQTPIRGRRIDSAATTLGDEAARDLADVLAQPFIVMRNDHQDALAAGLAVSEYAPSGKSAEEISGLWQWAEAKLNDGLAAGAGVELHPIEFPIMRVRTAKERAELASPSWAEASISWDSGL
jgi:chromosome partitioning protein